MGGTCNIEVRVPKRVGGLSFAMVLDDPGRARERALAWCRDVLELRGGGEAQTALAMAQRCGVPEKEALLLTALGHAGDCGAIVDGLSPAVLLLTNLCARNPDELYPPTAVLEYVGDRWTPELGVNVLRRTVALDRSWPATRERRRPHRRRDGRRRSKCSKAKIAQR